MQEIGGRVAGTGVAATGESAWPVEPEGDLALSTANHAPNSTTSSNPRIAVTALDAVVTLFTS